MERAKLLTYTLDMGQEMLWCGAEVSRVEDTVWRLLTCFGAVRVDVITIPSSITLTAAFPDGEVLTQLRRIDGGRYDTDFARLSRYNDLSRRICSQKGSGEELAKGLEEIRCQKQGKKDALGRLFGYCLGASAFTVFLGGAPQDGGAAAVVGLLLYFGDGLLKRVHMQRLLRTFFLSLLAGLAAILPGLVSPLFHPGSIMIGTIMLLIPGIAMTNSVRDMLMGDTISGTLRLVESLLIACFIAAGFASALLLSQSSWPVSQLGSLADHAWVQIVTAGISAFGFCFIFRVPKKSIWGCCIGCSLCWGVYLLCQPLLGDGFASQTVAALFGAGYAEVMARLTRTPATVYLMPALIAMVPGRGLYCTMEAMVRGSRGEILQWGTDTAVSALALAVGIVAVAALLSSFHTFRRAIRLKKGEKA